MVFSGNSKACTLFTTVLIFFLFFLTPGFASSVQLQWDANTETDLAGYKVYYNIASIPLAGTVPLDVRKQTTATISGLNPDHAYSFAVTAYNASGVESSFSNIVTVPEQTPPMIAMTAPADTASVSGTVSISVNASDNVGVTKVEFSVNGVLKNSAAGAPYVYSWDTTLLAPGSYTLMTRAYDAVGNVSQSSRTVNVVHDLIAPTVVLTSPANNATLSGTVAISANASDNVGVSMVEFYINNTLFYVSNLAPYSYNWDTRGVGNGTYSLIVKAFDNSAHITQSSTVSVTVSNPLPISENLTIADALLALQIGSGKVTATTEQMIRLDVAPVIMGKSSPDGKVDTGDAIVILSKVVGKPVF